MKLLDLSFAQPSMNLAFDEALLVSAEDGDREEVLRFWEATVPFVVLGYSRPATGDVDLEACRRDGIPVLRRYSGGGTVLQAPGCLSYALVLRSDRSEEFSTISGTTRAVLEKHRIALAPLLTGEVLPEGDSDLAIGGMKFSGNAQRRMERMLVFHGTFLLSLDIALIDRYLTMPDRQPAYRRRRVHRDFVSNIPLSAVQVREALASVWGASDALDDRPISLAEKLDADRYSRSSWTMKC